MAHCYKCKQHITEKNKKDFFMDDCFPICRKCLKKMIQHTQNIVACRECDNCGAEEYLYKSGKYKVCINCYIEEHYQPYEEYEQEQQEHDNADDILEDMRLEMSERNGH